MLDWREEPIGRDQDRKAFDCGSQELNDYLRRHARQNHEGGGSKTFVAVDVAAPKTILGYYSISPASIAFAKVPAALTKGLGHYEVAVFRLARLAVALPMLNHSHPYRFGDWEGVVHAASRRGVTGRRGRCSACQRS